MATTDAIDKGCERLQYPEPEKTRIEAVRLLCHGSPGCDGIRNGEYQHLGVCDSTFAEYLRVGHVAVEDRLALWSYTLDRPGIKRQHLMGEEEEKQWIRTWLGECNSGG